MKSLIFFHMLLLTANISDAQNIKTWKEYPVVTNSDSLENYRLTNIFCHVYLSNGEAYVKDHKDVFKWPLAFTPANSEEEFEFCCPYNFQEVPDGYLILFRHLEMPGILYWFSKDGKQHYKIKAGGFIQFVERKSEVFILESRIRSGMSSLKQMINEHDKWVIHDYYDFPSSAFAAQIDDHNNIFIVTNGGLFSIGQDKKIISFIDVGMWSGYLLPNSIVIKNDIVYIGMEKGVVKYDVNTDLQTWLQP